MITMVLAAAAAVTAAAAPAVVSKACDAKPTCRWVGTFELRTPDGGVQTGVANTDFDFVDNGRLSLLPGEMVVVRLEEAGDGTTTMVVTQKGRAKPASEASADTFVAQVSPEALDEARPLTSLPDDLKARDVPANSIRLSFQQLAGKPDMMLVVENGYGQPIDYQAGMMLLDGRHKYTTACEVRPKLTSYEHWPHPIVMIDVGAFRFLPAGKTGIACD